jgi:hypothetical protein
MRRLSFFLALAAILSGQQYRGSVSGTITDAQGAAVPKALVVATEIRTGTKSEVSSENTGHYTIPFLAPGEYEITVEVPGFKKFVRKGISLNAGDQPVIDVSLEVGAVSDSVTVTAEAPLINDANASLGQTITTDEVENFPVNGRTPMMLAHMAFGVLSTFEPGPVRPFDNGSGNSFSVAGSKSGSNELLLNGQPNTGASRQMAYSPSQDAVQEVRVAVFDADAAYVHSGGGTVNVITKSGTNAFRGVLSEYNQQAGLNANGFIQNRNRTPRPPYHYNQYGLTASGPVYVPKVFNGRNKVFWLFSFEGLRDSTPANSPIETGSPVNFATVPTDAERRGDFSQLLAKAGSVYAIYDPNTGTPTGSGTQLARTPFPNNIIPATRLNKLATNLLKYFPAPNNPTPDINDGRNFIVAAINKDNYDNEMGQLDFNLGDKHKLSFNVRHNYRVQDKNDYFHNGATGSFLYRINQGASLEHTYTIGPSMFANVRGSWTRYMENRGWPSDGMDITALGFAPNVAGNSQGLKFPRIVFTSSSISAGSMSSFQQLGTDDNGGSVVYDSFALFGSLIKIRGNHTIKVGADARQYRYSNYAQGYSSGYYTFNSNWTKGPTTSSTAAPLGQDFAAFLLGLPSSGQFDINAQSSALANYYAVFLQDDWRARRDLTLNIGLRFEHDTSATERFNRAVTGFDGAIQNPLSAKATAAFQSALAAGAYAGSPLATIPFKVTGGLTFASPSSRALYHPHSYVFSPRFGFAWTPARLGRKTVFRGGFAVFATPVELLGNGLGGSPTLNQAGFSQTTQLTATNDNYLTPVGTFNDPFPGGIVAPTGSSAGAGTFVGQALTVYNSAPRDPIMLRWNFNVQRELPFHIVFETAYIGQHSVRLPINTALNTIPRQYLSTSPLRDQPTIDMLTGAVTNPFRGLVATGGTWNANTIQRQYLLYPYPEFSTITLVGNPAGSGYFHGLSARVQKRFTNNLVLLYNFMYSKLISKTNYLNPTDSAPEKRVGDDHRPLRNVLAVSYTLPVGHGQRFAPRWRAVDVVIGGWSTNAIMTFQSGSQLGWGNYIYFGGPLNLNTHQPNGPAFDTTRFMTDSTLQLANNIQTFNSQFGNLRRDMVKNVDFSMTKQFRITEHTSLRFRLEAFNVSNRVTFGNPSTSPTAANFGLISTQVNTPRRMQAAIRFVW